MPESRNCAKHGGENVEEPGAQARHDTICNPEEAITDANF